MRVRRMRGLQMFMIVLSCVDCKVPVVPFFVTGALQIQVTRELQAHCHEQQHRCEQRKQVRPDVDVERHEHTERSHQTEQRQVREAARQNYSRPRGLELVLPEGQRTHDDAGD